MKKIYLALTAALALLTAACTGDLDQKPVIGNTAEKVYSSVEGYRSVLAKIYGSYSLVGQERAGNADISSNKGQDLIRNIFHLQEAPTDEVANTWLSGDNLGNLTYMSWDATDIWVSDTYYRLLYSVALCNEFLRYCSDSALSAFSATDREEILTYAAEARFIRALDYFWVMDLFGKGPYVTPDDPTSGYIPPAYTAAQLYDFIISEINALENLLPETAQYPRATRAAAWALGVRASLNAEVYTGTPHYSECIAYARKIMALGYSLEPVYSKLFNADNHLRTNEIIFAFAADSQNATTWGSATNVICASCGNNSTQDPAKYGIANGWGNWRVRGELPALFQDGDLRGSFWTDGQTQYFTGAIDNQAEGYFSEKWTNLTDQGTASSNSAADGCDTDFPIFRLAEVYLAAAEAVVRGGEGMSASEALSLVNLVRVRAFGGDEAGKISAAQMNVQFFLDERGREFFHEMHRRTDLIRFGRFAGDKYIWQWKGGVLDGRATDARYNLYPIPATEISANPNLSNPGY